MSEEVLLQCLKKNDLVKVNNDIGIVKERINKKYLKILLLSGKLIISEERNLSKFDRNTEILKIQQLLKNADWTKLDNITINCPKCKQLILILKNLSLNGEVV